MERKPDMIRTLVYLFAVGLVISGVTSLQAADDRQDRASGSQDQQEVIVSSRQIR